MLKIENTDVVGWEHAIRGMHNPTDSWNKRDSYYCVGPACPEDAMIGRDLFSGKDFINAITLGFNIAKSGYDEIVVDEVPWEDE